VLIYTVLYTVFNVKGKILLFRAVNACGRCRRTGLLVIILGARWKVSSGFKPWPLYPIEWETEWVSEPILILWRREKSLPGFEPGLPSLWSIRYTDYAVPVMC
jgi:hypothetical protein